MQGSADKADSCLITDVATIYAITPTKCDRLLQNDMCQSQHFSLAKPITQFPIVIIFVCIGHLILLFALSFTFKVPKASYDGPPIQAQLYFVERKPIEYKQQAKISAIETEVLPQIQPSQLPVPIVLNPKTKPDDKVSTIEKLHSPQVSLAEQTLQSLASQVYEQAKTKEAIKHYQEFIDTKHHIGRSVNPYFPGAELGELKVKQKQISCENVINKGVSVLSGLMGGTITCEELPAVSVYIKKRFELEGGSNR